MHKIIAILTLAFSLALAGCEPTTKTVCPALKTYSRAQLAQMAAGYPSLPEWAKSVISDWRLWRKKCAALQQ
jgi:hypothetical protein